MGGKKSKPEPPPPQKTVKEMVKESSRSINRMRNEFKREIMKQEQTLKKQRKDLEKMIKNKDPKSHQQMVAKQIVKCQGYITKYNRLDAQLNDVLFQLNTCATTDTLVKVMTGMNNVMKATNEQMDVNNIQKVMEQFNMQCEKQEMMGEMISDMMESNDDVDMDDEAEKILMEAEKSAAGTGGGGQQQLNTNQQAVNQNQEQDNLDARLQALKQ
ncbi:hypothetical protein PPERSA_06550 [Pseudocohnilembus persalinus]|uniref:Snf7 family n=1 Tax=Pseudocohnilembus persalinus TaxID=266149 RepID=A0A0V0QRQ7_PSEPJ|nr:hypothetical protein PPERSA_06550 [Pseudocohnilembus persalinus]|eukprot:KRX04916.1 hypothetical protein PPERSA_06550 [Pseudocohnilembus persalinus]